MKYTIIISLLCLFSLLALNVSSAERSEVLITSEEEVKPANETKVIDQIERTSEVKATNQVKAAKKSSVIQETVLGMNVSGNKELPNVLYIVPWKGGTGYAKTSAPTRLVGEIFAPVDPDAFSKKVMFYKQLTDKKVSETKN